MLTAELKSNKQEPSFKFKTLKILCICYPKYVIKNMLAIQTESNIKSVYFNP